MKETKDNNWLMDCKKGRFSDSPEDQRRAVSLLDEIGKASIEKVDKLTNLAGNSDCEPYFRKKAIRAVFNLRSSFSLEQLDELINFTRRLSDNREDEEQIRVLSYEKYRYLKADIYGGLSEDELAREKDLAKDETGLQMQWLRRMRD